MAQRVVPGSITKPYTPQPGDFSPNLVGFQFTSSSALLTFGNFEITTNLEPLTGQIFNTGEFSESFNLENLNLTEQESNEIYLKNINNLSVKLNNDKTNFLNYVYFSDAVTFVEGEVTNIVLNWKGSLFLQKSTINDTLIDFTYNNNNNTSTFKIPVFVAQNIFGLFTFETLETASNENDISILKQSFDKYEIKNTYGNFNVIGYTGNTPTDNYITIKTEGLSWPNLNTGTTNSGSFTYHVKPKDSVLDKIFFNKLTDFQNQLLNRLVTPKYTVELNIPRTNDQGVTINDTFTLTWPTSDGYNLDIGANNLILNPTSGIDYGEYLDSLFSLAKKFDKDKTNIIARRLLSTSIFEFDTNGDGTENSGRKINKLVKIWGREYDSIKKYIDGISFANTVTYDGKDNTPDELIKMMAKNLGFDTIQSFANNDLINYLVTTTNAVFSGHSRSLTIQELDTELWRRLIINAWWLFKSKGTRKVIEFFLKLFQIDECLIDFNEYVYLAEERLNRDEVVNNFRDIFGDEFVEDELNLTDLPERIIGDDGTFFGVETVNNDLPIDAQGYPRILPDTPEYYFQLDGFWYDGGVSDGDIPDTNGNNPHFGPYDYGAKYFNKFRCFIDQNTAINNDIRIINNRIVGETEVNLNTLTFNYFTDYTLGLVEGGQQSTTTINGGGVTNTTAPTNNLATYDQFYANVMNTTGRISSGTTVINAGRTTQNSNNGLGSFQINFTVGDLVECDIKCPTILRFREPSGIIEYESPINSNKWQALRSQNCCSKNGGYSYYDNTFPFIPTPGLAEEEGGPTKCYWCPPKEYLTGAIRFIEDKLGNTVQVTQFFFEQPNGQLKPLLNKNCCEIRGYKWDVNKRVCTVKNSNDPLTPIDSGGGITTG